MNIYNYSLNNPVFYRDPSGVYLGKPSVELCNSLSHGECGYVASFLTATSLPTFRSYIGCFIKICRKKCTLLPSCTTELYCGALYPPA